MFKSLWRAVARYLLPTGPWYPDFRQRYLASAQDEADLRQRRRILRRMDRGYPSLY